MDFLFVLGFGGFCFSYSLSNTMLACNDNFYIKPAFMFTGNLRACWSLTHSSSLLFLLRNILSWSSEGHGHTLDHTEYTVFCPSDSGFGSLLCFIGQMLWRRTWGWQFPLPVIHKLCEFSIPKVCHTCYEIMISGWLLVWTRPQQMVYM